MKSARDRQGRFVSTPQENHVVETDKPSKMTKEELKRFERLRAEANSKPGVLDYLEVYASCQASQDKAIQRGYDRVNNKKKEIKAIIDAKDDGSIKSINLVDADNNFLALIRFRDGSPIRETKGVIEIFINQASSKPKIITINAENKLGPGADGGLYDYVHWTSDESTSE